MTLFEGVYAAAVTPRRLGVQDINLGVMWELVDFLVSRRVNGLVLLGSTGEFVHFSNPERMRVMGLAAKRSQIPVIMNVSHSTLDGSVELAEAATASGAAALLLAPPHFFRYDDNSLLSYYRAFRREAGLATPVVLYNIPAFCNGVPAALVKQLLAEGCIQGVKDSSGNRAYLAELASLRRDQPFALLAGNDALFAEGLQNEWVEGAVSGVASALPELPLAIYRAAKAGSHDRVAHLNARLKELLAWIDRFPAPVCIREASAARGIKVGPHAIPLQGEMKERAGDFQHWFAGWIPSVLGECDSA